jgi:two-component system, oxyanion-binding sensor
MKRVTAGFLPLLDAAILIAAKEKGFAEEQGIDLHLVRDSSWANIRDRVSVGQFDVAQMLAPLPIAQNLGLSPLSVDMIAPFALGLGGNAITVSQAMWDDLLDVGGDPVGDAARAGQGLRQVLAQRKAKGLPILTLAVVHDYSAHAYELRYWLSASGINPNTELNIAIVPPGLMPDALVSGTIDGFCVGEPWNSVAVASGAGHVLTTKGSIWRSSPEKVLGLTRRWAEQDPERLDQLLLALHHSAKWCANPKHAEELSKFLQSPHYLNLPSTHFTRGLMGNDGFLHFYDLAANFPWQSHALWFYAQMVRWGQVTASDEAHTRARTTYRPDIYRRAVKSTGIALPGANLKIEGALQTQTYIPAQGGQLVLGPDGFFDGVAFDPDKLDDYVKASPFYAAMHKI